MKVYIQYHTTNSAYGGANQFLKALKKYFVNKGVYERNPRKADIVLFNSSNYPYETIRNKRKCKKAVFVHRMDGPVKLYNSLSDIRDDIAYNMNNLLADATVFQSDYSRRESVKAGIPRNNFETVINNAADGDLFFKKNIISERPRKIIISSFSSNMKKGFSVYKYLDENLDFDKYEVEFVGNSPIDFKNIKMIGPLCSERLAEELRRCDLYITASEKEPCSNSLIEALSCGLPVIARNDGGNPELIGEGGRLFDKKEEIIGLIEDIFLNYKYYANKAYFLSFREVGEKYIEFFEYILKSNPQIKNMRYEDVQSVQTFLRAHGVEREFSLKKIYGRTKSRLYGWLVNQGFVKKV